MAYRQQPVEVRSVHATACSMSGRFITSLLHHISCCLSRVFVHSCAAAAAASCTMTPTWFGIGDVAASASNLGTPCLTNKGADSPGGAFCYINDHYHYLLVHTYSCRSCIHSPPTPCTSIPVRELPALPGRIDTKLTDKSSKTEYLPPFVYH